MTERDAASKTGAARQTAANLEARFAAVDDMAGRSAEEPVPQCFRFGLGEIGVQVDVAVQPRVQWRRRASRWALATFGEAALTGLALSVLSLLSSSLRKRSTLTIEIDGEVARCR